MPVGHVYNFEEQDSGEPEGKALEARESFRLNLSVRPLPKALNVMNLESSVSKTLTLENDATTAENNQKGRGRGFSDCP